MIDPTINFDNITSVNALDIKEALNVGIDLTQLVGKSVPCRSNNEILTWDVADYDETNESITLLLHNALPTKLPFDSAQALAYFEDGLAEGPYKFVYNDNFYYFTLTKAIPSGGQLVANVVASPTRFTTYASQDSTEELETGTVSKTEIQNAQALGTCGVGELNDMNRVSRGSNNFAESGLFQWLNSSASANAPMPMVTKFSRPYSVDAPGFLGTLDYYSFAKCLDNTVWKCSANRVYECPASMGGIAVKNMPYTVTSKIALASYKEMFGTSGHYDVVDAGDAVYDLFVNATNADRIKRSDDDTASIWWLRSPDPSHTYNELGVSTSGGDILSTVGSNYGVVPVCKISKSS